MAVSVQVGQQPTAAPRFGLALPPTQSEQNAVEPGQSHPSAKEEGLYGVYGDWVHLGSDARHAVTRLVGTMPSRSHISQRTTRLASLPV